MDVDRDLRMVRVTRRRSALANLANNCSFFDITNTGFVPFLLKRLAIRRHP